MGVVYHPVAGAIYFDIELKSLLVPIFDAVRSRRESNIGSPPLTPHTGTSVKTATPSGHRTPSIASGATTPKSRTSKKRACGWRPPP